MSNVGSLYYSLQKLRQAGVVPGVDMTAEAALTKLSYLLTRDLKTEQIREMVQHNLRGELTTLSSHQQQFSLKDSELLKTVAQALNVSSNKVNGSLIAGTECWLQSLWL